MFTENPDLKEVQEFFAKDRYATEQTGCVVVEARKGFAVAEMEIKDHHRNGFGSVMGGAIFTLADFALAISCNIAEDPTVSVSNTIEFLSASKGTKLIATAKVDKSGRHMGFYTVDVTDDTGRHIARMTATCFR